MKELLQSHAELRGALRLAIRDLETRKILTKHQTELLKILRRVTRESRQVAQDHSDIS